MTDNTRAFENRTSMAKNHPIGYFLYEITDTLNEWNEECSFDIENGTVVYTEQGIIVTGVLWHRNDRFEDGEWKGYENERHLDGQFIALYGDGDELAHLSIFTNPGVETLIDHTIRS